MYRCFEESLDARRLDREPFVLGHRLLGHDALTLENLARVLPALPAEQVMFSKDLLGLHDDFEETFRGERQDVSLSQVLEQIRTGSSYIMVRSPEAHPSFAELHRALLADVESAMHARGIPGAAKDAQLYLFIASPGAITPFHIDRYSTFLLQFRGTKQVSVFPQWDERVVSARECEDYATYQSTRLAWDDSREHLGIRFEFTPGMALHIPFMAGHHVKNGMDDVSISMSIIFNTQESVAWQGALGFNSLLRRVLDPLGMRPARVAANDTRDAVKARAYETYQRLQSVRRRVAG